MGPVTHVTIGVGGVWLGERLWRRWRGGAALPTIAYRFAAVGALVPDLIDKPLAKLGVSGFSYGDAAGYGDTAGHTIGHTLLVLGLGSITHPLVDPTNSYPGVLFWPLFGTDFPASHQPYRFFQIPLDILLLVTYAMLVWRSAKWRGRARRFLLSGTFPFTDNGETERAPLYTRPR